MTPSQRTPADIERENAYLRLRLSQAELDIADLNAELGRLREERERLHGRMAARQPNPLGSGRSSNSPKGRPP